MNWIALENAQQIENIATFSSHKIQVIFKHSTRCNISDMALGRLERDYKPVDADFYYLDLIRFRELSKLTAERFEVHHESPQLIVLLNGECFFDASHFDIRFAELIEQINLAKEKLRLA